MKGILRELIDQSLSVISGLNKSRHNILSKPTQVLVLSVAQTLTFNKTSTFKIINRLLDLNTLRTNLEY